MANRRLTMNRKIWGWSYLSSALGQLGCRSGHRVTYRRVPRLLEEASLAKADGTYTKLLASLAKADVLVLDDPWARHPS